MYFEFLFAAPGRDLSPAFSPANFGDVGAMGIQSNKLNALNIVKLGVNVLLLKANVSFRIYGRTSLLQRERSLRTKIIKNEGEIFKK